MTAIMRFAKTVPTLLVDANGQANLRSELFFGRIDGTGKSSDALASEILRLVRKKSRELAMGA